MADHLAVLIHGLWGNPNHLNYLRDTLRKQYPEDKLHILVAKSNSDNQTYDGIEVGGERIVNEIEQELESLKKGGSEVKKISITGYSLGGLVARYAIGLMYSNGLFDRIQPVNFTTFATPHIGVRTPKLGYRGYIWNFLGAKTLSTSGQQLFLVDDFRKSGRHLLSIMADPSSIFMKGLGLFKNKWLYANTMNDRSVPYYTAMFSRVDEYSHLDKIEVNYLKDQPQPGEVILDPDHPVTPRKSLYDEMTAYQRLSTVPRRAASVLPYYIIIFTLFPLAFPVFMANAGYQTYKSAQRVRDHESGKAFKLDRYRVKLLEEAQAVQDRVYGRLADSQREEYLPSPPPEGETLPEHKEGEELQGAELSRRESRREKSHFKILALKEQQFDMIANLDELGFTKYPVHIHKVQHTHAAVVVRTQKESFNEGKVVVKHWVEKLEI